MGLALVHQASNVKIRFMHAYSCGMVFSGHGGARAAEYVKQNLFSNLIRHPNFISDTKSAIGLSPYCASNATFCNL